MKRNKGLHSLSHDHHHGLLLAQLIKKGSPRYPNLPKTTKGKVDYTLRFYNNELIRHFESEEHILFKIVYGRNWELDSLIDELKSEHKKIKSLVGELKESNEKEICLDKLGNLLEKHIRKEERKVFNLIEKQLSEEELKTIGEQLIKST